MIYIDATEELFLMPISFQPDDVNFRYFKLEFIWSNSIHSLKYKSSMALFCKDTEILEIVYSLKEPVQHELFRYLKKSLRS